ncbi:myozenin-3 [Paramormyrops kingsleyae]|uniref:myozenin-3 n=1 Tax=Paramormyrops kingsleyae TaxID=1676925 RepID=UPI003B979D8F
MIQNSYEELAKRRKQPVKDLGQEVLGEYLNLGKKISAPQDVMMEELKLLTNRGSRMFHERLRRVDKFILENAGRASGKVAESSQAKRSELESGGEDDGKGSFQTEVFIKQPGRNSLVSALKGTVANKGSPDTLAPGYAKPLKDIPHEKFNVTVIPKSYYSPWREDLGAGEKLLATIHAHLPELAQKLTPADYKCFNRAPVPFRGTAGSARTLPLPGFELALAHTEPSLDWDRISRRPNFNRAPQGWGLSKKPESMDL